MIIISYSATRKMIAGRILNDPVTLEINIEDDDDTPKMVAHDLVSMGGAVIKVHERNEEFFSMLTVAVKDDKYLALRECMCSINAGEVFFIDRYNDGVFVEAMVTAAPVRIEVNRRIYKYSLKMRISE